MINNINLKQTLIHIWCNLNSVAVTELIIQRVKQGLGQNNDSLERYLKRDGLRNSFDKNTTLQEYLNRTDCFGVRPIHLACHFGDITMIKLLRDNGCDPFKPTEDGLTCIHSAAEGDSVNVSIYLITIYLYSNWLQLYKHS